MLGASDSSIKMSSELVMTMMLLFCLISDAIRRAVELQSSMMVSPLLISSAQVQPIRCLPSR